jgi:hypothetical protein
MKTLTTALVNDNGGMGSGHLAVEKHTSRHYPSGPAYLSLVFVKAADNQQVFYQIIDTSGDGGSRYGDAQWAKAGDIVNLKPWYWVKIYNNSSKDCLLAYNVIRFPNPVLLPARDDQSQSSDGSRRRKSKRRRRSSGSQSSGSQSSGSRSSSTKQGSRRSSSNSRDSLRG